ncbi:XRE family transcriptional regulator [Ruminococcaceae bacterium OttesenSCG-928-A16]|nr:XRE family transcriptional regulator [Ruminococcaceae bacterium OttesenSCG-928-A16]
MLGDCIKQLRKQKKVTQNDLATHMGVTQQAVGKWETGRSLPDSETLLRLAQYFGVSADVLLGTEDIAPPTQLPLYNPAMQVQVPIVGTVRAGYGALAFEEDYGTEPATVRDPENYFYLLVKGDSMEPRIQDGDLALVRRQPSLDDGDLGVVVYGEGEGTLKRFLRRGNAIVLQPFNPSYDAVVIKGEELENLYVAGKVVETKARW